MKTLIVISLFWILPNGDIKTDEISLTNNCDKILVEYNQFGEYMIKEKLFLEYNVKCKERDK